MRDITVHGSGTSNLTIQMVAGNNFRLFAIDAAANCEIDSLSLSGGNPVQNGGAIYNAGTLTLQAADIANSKATFKGGAIYNGPAATLELTSCNMHDNSVSQQGDGAGDLQRHGWERHSSGFCERVQQHGEQWWRHLQQRENGY
jgi:hypothetical protein